MRATVLGRSCCQVRGSPAVLAGLRRRRRWEVEVILAPGESMVAVFGIGGALAGR
jgi:hypothetical protein